MEACNRYSFPCCVAEVLHTSKSLSSLPQDEKDYFQVTDELSQENSHFALSEALLAVIEQYKATWLEQLLREEQFSLSSSSSPPPSLPSCPSLSSSPCATPTDSYLSSWGSMSSIVTNPEGKGLYSPLCLSLYSPPLPPDSVDGRASRGLTRVSLLELMKSKSCDHSAESTAQKLLQHMAGHMTGPMKDISRYVCHNVM